MSEILEVLDRDDARRERKYLMNLVKTEADLDLLYQVIKKNDNRKGSYASWVYTNGTDRFKFHIKELTQDLIQWLPNVETQGILRSMLRSVSKADAPKEQESEWIDLCFQYLMKPQYEVAVKVHAMQILFLFCKRYPELIPELKIVIEEGQELYTAALRARSKNILKALKKFSKN